MLSHPVVGAAATWRASQLPGDASDRMQAQTQLELGPETVRSRLLLTDADGKILCLSANASVEHWKAGDRIAWHDIRESRIPGEPNVGHIETSSGPLMAVAYPPNEGGVQVVAVAEATTVSTRTSSLHRAVPMASGIAFVWTLILCAVATHLLSARFNIIEAQRREQHDHDALRSAQDLLRTRDAVIFGLAKLAESRDPDTGDHLERISLYTTRLAMAIRPFPKYQHVVTPTFIRLLGISSVLHDIGKVGLQDTVLLKAGRLSSEERKRMEQHTLVAGDCLREIEQRLGASNFLQTAREIALHHHERWDGNGYPSGLSGEDIPLAARIVSIADVYDALRSKRVYKEALPHEECVQAIRENAGTQFDPDLVEVFLEIEHEFDAISRRFANETAAKVDRLALKENQDSRQPDLMSPEQEATLCEVIAIADQQLEPQCPRVGVSSA